MYFSWLVNVGMIISGMPGILSSMSGTKCGTHCTQSLLNKAVYQIINGEQDPIKWGLEDSGLIPGSPCIDFFLTGV